MARDITDVKTVYLSISGKVSIDLERIELDPIWVDISSNYPHLPSKDIFFLYLSKYVQSDKFLSEAPFTNGPGNLQLLEVTNG